MAVKAGSWGVRAAEGRQDREFKPLMCCEGLPAWCRVKAPRQDKPLMVSLFYTLVAYQPREAWIMGNMAGWPECRRVV